MAKITLTAFADMHNEHRQQMTRLRKTGRIDPAPTMGITPSGRIAYLVEPTAKILTLAESRKKGDKPPK